MEQLRRGAPFAAVAQQFSQGASAASGGDLGWVLPGALDPSLDAALERVQPRSFSEPVRSASGWHILYVVDRRPFAAARPDDVKLNLVQMTLALPPNASPEETNRATAEAQKAMSGVRQCSDLHVQSRQAKGSTSGDLNGVRVGDLAANPQMYEQLPRLPIGGTAGPFRVAEGLQVVALCSKCRRRRHADPRRHLAAASDPEARCGRTTLHARPSPAGDDRHQVVTCRR